MIVKLRTEHHLEFLSLKGGYTGSSESTNVKMPHCWKSHTLAQITNILTKTKSKMVVAQSLVFHESCPLDFTACADPEGRTRGPDPL